MRKILAISLLIMSALFVIQLRSYVQNEEVQQYSKRDSLSELSVFQAANNELKVQLKQENDRIAELKSQLSKASFEGEIATLKLISGTEPVVGDGIEIVVDKAIPAYWITDMIAQLTSAGAEVIAINGKRYIDRTAGLRDVAGGLLIHSEFTLPPYTITAIGPQNDLRDSIAQPGGLIDRLKKHSKNTKVIVGLRNKLVIGPVD